MAAEQFIATYCNTGRLWHGKTSFAKRMAYVVADEHQRSNSGRIPILIPLAEISAEQNLEGLLGRLFSAQNAVPNYHFGLFMELNSRGRFCVILDGFDEMKHTMTWRDFRQNILQLNRLITSKSKVILLGRPSALMSEVEEYFVLKGLKKDRERVLTIEGAPRYQELELQPFTEEQAYTFVEHYARYMTEDASTRRGHLMSEEEVLRRLAEARNDEKLKELITRPVQAKMIADLAIDPEVAWRSFSRYELYDQFVSRIIDRESLKPTRFAFSEEQRRRFVESVAWWLWRKGGATSFDASELPKSIVDKFSPDDGEEDVDGVTRDLLSGSLLERKTGDKYYFPHRSFLEFLLARHVALTRWSPQDLAEVSEALNPEIASFLKESGEHARIAAWGEQMTNAESPISIRFLELVAWAMNNHGAALDDAAAADLTPGHILLNYLRLVDKVAPASQIVTYLVRSFEGVVKLPAKAMCLLALLLAREASIVDFRGSIGRLVAALILREALPEIMNISDRPAFRFRGFDVFDAEDPFTRMVVSTMRGQSTGGGAMVVHVDWNRLYEELNDELPPQWRLSEGLSPPTLRSEQLSYAELGNVAKTLKMTEKGAYVLVPAPLV